MEKLSSLINKLPEELIEKVLEDLEIDELESILTTNNNKLIRIAKPILEKKEKEMMNVFIHRQDAVHACFGPDCGEYCPNRVY